MTECTRKSRQRDREAGDFFDGQENGVDRPVAGGHFLGQFLLAALQRQPHGRLALGAAVHPIRRERPGFRHVENLLFAQRGNVAVVDFLLLVGQLLELLEHGLQLLAGEMIARGAVPDRPAPPGRCACRARDRFSGGRRPRAA